MRYLRYLSTQALDEGFVPAHLPGTELFYRTDDWPRYKSFKGHGKGQLTKSQMARYDRHAGEVAKLLAGSYRVLSLGGGTGSLEQRLADIVPSCTYVVSDIYEREPVRNVTFSHVDMSDTTAIGNALVGIDTVLVSNALSPLLPTEVDAMFDAIGKSGATKIIVYSAEDIRPLGYFLTNLKRLLRPRLAMWVGYLYGSKYIGAKAKKAGFQNRRFWKPNEHGVATPLWGSVYLACFSKATLPIAEINSEELRM